MDSSLTHFGWACLESDGPGDAPRLVDVGLLCTEKDAENLAHPDAARRILEIGAGMRGLVERFSPVLASIESLALPFGTSKKTVSMLGRVRGVVDGVCFMRGLRLVEIEAKELKEFATGDKGADKPAMVAAMQQRHPRLRALLAGYSATKSNYEVGDIADACAVASWAWGAVAADWRAT